MPDDVPVRLCLELPLSLSDPCSAPQGKGTKKSEHGTRKARIVSLSLFRLTYCRCTPSGIHISEGFECPASARHFFTYTRAPFKIHKLPRTGVRVFPVNTTCDLSMRGDTQHLKQCRGLAEANPHIRNTHRHRRRTCFQPRCVLDSRTTKIITFES